MCRLKDEEVETNIEVGLSKMRYEIRKQRDRELDKQVDIESAIEEKNNNKSKKIKLDVDKIDEKKEIEQDKIDAKVGKCLTQSIRYLIILNEE